MRKIKKKTVCVILIIIVAIIVIRWCSNPEHRIFAMVERNQERYDKVVEQLLNGEVSADEVNAPGVQDVKIRMGEHVIIDFYVTGFGLAPSSTYYGFYYSSEDIPVAYMNETTKLTEYEIDAWKWQGGGDNAGIIKKIRDNWYYYKVSF